MHRHLIDQDAPLIDALNKLNALPGGAMTLMALASDGRMVGTLTDGDIRRALLRGVALTAPVAEAMRRNFRSLRTGEDCVEPLRTMRSKLLRLIPVLDAQGRLVEIIDTEVTTTRLPLTAILMAGGKGERLRPLTLTVPKPLLPVAGRPIIDYNIEALARVGITDITVTVNYLAEQLEAHFAEPVAGVKVNTVREQFPMGTIGSAALATIPPAGDTIVMNSDLLTTARFEEMYLHHRQTGAMITIAAIPYGISIPYAILTTEGNRVTALEEKPSYSYYANAGIYIINNSLLRGIPADKRTDATDLIEQAIADGLHVSYFPLDGTWIDIGSPADYAHASDLMAKFRDFAR